jgi:N6-L-threonylcarbamoyladenine synthase
MLVYILDKDNKPLMPCSPRVAKLLLRNGKATVAQRTPFTIKLLFGSSGYKQDVTLGVDAGSKTIGLSVTTDKKELFSAEVQLRTDIVDLLSTRKQNRGLRRSHKTRYRKVRFLNRRIDKGWLAPSIRHKIDTHLTMVDKIHKILPITNIIVEVAQFDIQKIKNPDVSGVEYQQGVQLDFFNAREYVLYRDDHKCQLCNGKSKDKILNVHHIESRKTGGNAPNNLITLCETCHKKHHDGDVTLKIKRGHIFKDPAFMGIMRWALYNTLKEKYPNVKMTYGYITKNTRIAVRAKGPSPLPKDHRTDALCITGNPTVIGLDTWYYCKKVRCQNRQIHKNTINKGGARKLNQSPFIVFDIRLFDKVKYDNQECFVFGRRLSGSFDIRLLDGTTVNAGVGYKKVKLFAQFITECSNLKWSNNLTNSPLFALLAISGCSM